jgi:hypothetical protein
VSTSHDRGLRHSELEKLKGRKELFILYFIKTNVIRALRTACDHCAGAGGHWTLSMHHSSVPAPAAATTPIAGYRRALVLDNRTAYHGYFEFLRLGTVLSSSRGGSLTQRGGGSPTKRKGLSFMRWTHIDLGAQDLNGIQRPKLFFQIR